MCACTRLAHSYCASLTGSSSCQLLTSNEAVLCSNEGAMVAGYGPTQDVVAIHVTFVNVCSVTSKWLAHLSYVHTSRTTHVTVHLSP